MTPESVKVFHLHLDMCRQCNDSPMDLCGVGGDLLRKAATDPAWLATQLTQER